MLTKFLVHWLFYNIPPQSHNLYEKDPFTTLVFRDYHAPTNLPARGPTQPTSPPVDQLYEPVCSYPTCVKTYYKPPRS